MLEQLHQKILMPCYHPLTGYRSRQPGQNGKYRIVFDRNKSAGQIQKLPCGQCIGCRLERSRQWAIRCVHEASLYENNCFITLTYNEEHLPQDGSLNKAHFQKFMKRLRKQFPDSPIRYYHCGEYGEKLGRPHYHACLFNFDFQDKKYFTEQHGQKLFTSETLEKIWGLGFTTIGTVTFESAAYVARYIMKKVTGDKADTHYYNENTLDKSTGEIQTIEPEYTTMSRRPGIAKAWYDQYHSEIYPDDFVVIRGKTMRPPRYYDTIYEIENPEEYEALKEKRRLAMEQHNADNTEQRLLVRERCKEAQVSQLKRSLHET